MLDIVPLLPSLAGVSMVSTQAIELGHPRRTGHSIARKIQGTDTTGHPVRRPSWAAGIERPRCRANHVREHGDRGPGGPLRLLPSSPRPRSATHPGRRGEHPVTICRACVTQAGRVLDGLDAQRPSKPERLATIPSPRDIVAHLDRSVVGQAGPSAPWPSPSATTSSGCWTMPTGGPPTRWSPTPASGRSRSRRATSC